MKVFISSVRRGLEQERDSLPGLITAIGHESLRFEDFTAHPWSSRETCVRAVGQADVYVLLIGPAYGDPMPDTGLSATHEEYNAARVEGIPILVFRKEDVAMEAAQQEFESARLRRTQPGHSERPFPKRSICNQKSRPPFGRCQRQASPQIGQHFRDLFLFNGETNGPSSAGSISLQRMAQKSKSTPYRCSRPATRPVSSTRRQRRCRDTFARVSFHQQQPWTLGATTVRRGCVPSLLQELGASIRRDQRSFLAFASPHRANEAPGCDCRRTQWGAFSMPTSWPAASPGCSACSAA